MIKIDFPYPPKHYKEINSENFHLSPNIEALLSHCPQFTLFGRPENPKNSEVSCEPNYLLDQKVQYIKNTTIKNDLVLMVQELKRAFREYLEALNGHSESLVQI